MFRDSIQSAPALRVRGRKSGGEAGKARLWRLLRQHTEEVGAQLLECGDAYGFYATLLARLCLRLFQKRQGPHKIRSYADAGISKESAHLRCCRRAVVGPDD